MAGRAQLGKDSVYGKDRRLGIQRIENGFNQENIDPPFDQPASTCSP